MLYSVDESFLNEDSLKVDFSEVLVFLLSYNSF
jgi:hypothetical protein